VIAGTMRGRRRMHRHDFERLPGGHHRTEVGFPDLNHASTPVQLGILCGGVHGGGICVQGQDGARAGIGRHHGDNSGTGTTVEDALPEHDLPMLDEGFTIITGPEDRGRDHELFIEIGHQLSGGIHLAKLRMQSPLTHQDTGLQGWGEWRL